MSWLREMFVLFRQYRQAGKDYRAAQRALDVRIHELRQELRRGER